MRSFWTSPLAFPRNERGSVSILFGLSCIVLFVIMGIAIDSARYQDIASRTQAALDGASLAAAKMLEDESVPTGDVQQRAKLFFDASVPTFGVDVSYISPVTVNVDRDENSVESTVQIKVPTFFGTIAGLDRLTTINRAAKVVHDMGKLELSLVLDVTGSMNSNNKMNDMKAAASDLIEELMNGAAGEHSVRIALAPYSASVNAGDLAATISPVTPTNNCPSKPKKGESCVDGSGTVIDTCVIERLGTNASTDVAPLGADQLPNVPSTPYGKYSCPNATVVPLLGKSEKDTLKTILGGYTASGATAGHIGTAWGWYLLSEKWAGVLPSESAPQPYSDSKVKKIMIVMTDGLFNTSYISGPSTPDATQTSESYQRFQELCSGAKAENIEIYNIGYDLADATALSNLQTCASAPANFYDTDAGQLKEVFAAIVKKLNSLRVAS
jgi:Flp pilus assembly protein TadG